MATTLEDCVALQTQRHKLVDTAYAYFERCIGSFETGIFNLGETPEEKILSCIFTDATPGWLKTSPHWERYRFVQRGSAEEALRNIIDYGVQEDTSFDDEGGRSLTLCDAFGQYSSAIFSMVEYLHQTAAHRFNLRSDRRGQIQRELLAYGQREDGTRHITSSAPREQWRAYRTGVALAERFYHDPAFQHFNDEFVNKEKGHDESSYLHRIENGRCILSFFNRNADAQELRDAKRTFLDYYARQNGTRSVAIGATSVSQTERDQRIVREADAFTYLFPIYAHVLAGGVDVAKNVWRE